jgi:DNA-binding Xre family transcriptional regulator
VAEDYRHLGREVAQARSLKGWSTQQLADAMGMSKTTVENIEAGRRTRYRATTMGHLQDAIGWEPGAVDEVLSGGKPRPYVDPTLARVLAVWQGLTPDDQLRVAHYAEDLLHRQR